MSRTLARENAFKALFQLDFNHGDDDTRDLYEELALDAVLNEGRKISPDNQTYVRRVVKGTRNRLVDIDRIIADRLKKGRYVAMVGTLKISQNVKDDKTYTNLDVWVQALDAPQLGSGD